MTRASAIFLLRLVCLVVLPACADSSGLKIVKANPSLMKELGSKPRRDVEILSAEPQKSARIHNDSNNLRLRLPDMENLPDEKDLQSRPNSSNSPSSVIARPPSE